MFLRKSKLLGMFILLVCILLLASGCGKTPDTESTVSTSDSQKSSEPGSASNEDQTSNDSPTSNQPTAIPSPTQSTPAPMQVNGILQVH